MVDKLEREVPGLCECFRILHAAGAWNAKSELQRLIARHFVIYPKLRRWAKLRHTAMYWADTAGITAYAPSGIGRKRDLLAFEADFVDQEEHDGKRQKGGLDATAAAVSLI